MCLFFLFFFNCDFSQLFASYIPSYASFEKGITFELTDFPIDDAIEINLLIKKVEILAEDDSKITLFEPSTPKKVNFKNFTEGKTFKLFENVDLAAGKYKKFIIYLSESGNKIVMKDGEQTSEHDIDLVQSIKNNGILLDYSLEIANVSTEGFNLVADFDLSRAIKYIKSQDKYVLHKVIRISRKKSSFDVVHNDKFLSGKRYFIYDHKVVSENDKFSNFIDKLDESFKDANSTLLAKNAVASSLCKKNGECVFYNIDAGTYYITTLKGSRIVTGLEIN